MKSVNKAIEQTDISELEYYIETANELKQDLQVAMDHAAGLDFDFSNVIKIVIGYALLRHNDLYGTKKTLSVLVDCRDAFLSHPLKD